MNSSNSSKVDPEGVGNTDTPSVKRRRSSSSNNQDSPMKHWIITLKSSNRSIDLLPWIKEHCEAAIWQLEKGNDSDYIHYQVSLTLKVKKRLSWLKNHFHKTAHCEVMNNVNAAFDYTQKSDTRVAGPWFFPEQVKQGIDDPLDGKEYYPWQQNILNIINSTPDDRTINWIWEATGNRGKSSFCKHLVLKHKCTFALGKKEDVLFAIDENITTLLIDIPRGYAEHTHSLYIVLEMIKNGMVFSGKYESRVKLFNPPHVFVFSNFEPKTTELSEDRWNIIEL